MCMTARNVQSDSRRTPGFYKREGKLFRRASYRRITATVKSPRLLCSLDVAHHRVTFVTLSRPRCCRKEVIVTRCIFGKISRNRSVAVRSWCGLKTHRCSSQQFVKLSLHVYVFRRVCARKTTRTAEIDDDNIWGALTAGTFSRINDTRSNVT